MGRAAAVRPLREIPGWDDEADVIVVGLGAAGACAALEARSAGADTLVLERASGGGGTSALSTGQIYLGGGTPIQEKCGFEDSPDEMYRYLMASCGPGADAQQDPDLLRPTASSTSIGSCPRVSRSRSPSTATDPIPPPTTA